MGMIAGFRDLEVYRFARQEAKRVFLVSKRFPREETFSLTDQMRRSSRAVGAMIAESWARRMYPAAFVSKLDEALAEAMETQSWLDHALDCEYLTESEHRDLDAAWPRSGPLDIANNPSRHERFPAHSPSPTRLYPR